MKKGSTFYMNFNDTTGGRLYKRVLKCTVRAIVDGMVVYRYWNPRSQGWIYSIDYPESLEAAKVDT